MQVSFFDQLIKRILRSLLKYIIFSFYLLMIESNFALMSGLLLFLIILFGSVLDVSGFNTAASRLSRSPRYSPRLGLLQMFSGPHAGLDVAARSFLVALRPEGGLDAARSFLVCLQATSKSTVINDPTAGMSPAEIDNYISNVGGGLCNAPEPVRAAVGLGLNISLIVFGLFTVSYIVLGGLNFALERQVDDLVAGVQGTDGREGKKFFGDLVKDVKETPINTPPPPGSSSERPGQSREQRRLANRVRKNDP